MSVESEKKDYKCCFTGYRPSKFPFSLDKHTPEYKKFENTLIEHILKLVKAGCTTFFTGMAMGFDIIAAQTVLFVKNVSPAADIKLICVIPFKGQAESFPYYWKQKFEEVLNKADKTVILSDEYFPGCYQKRNCYMVDNSDYVLTWFDGKSGGTKNTLNYAVGRQRVIININNSFDVDFASQIKLDL